MQGTFIIKLKTTFLQGFQNLVGINYKVDLIPTSIKYLQGSKKNLAGNT